MGTAAANPDGYVSRDPHDVLRVAGTPVSLDSVVIAFQQGESPESICQSYPPLKLEQVYGAITYDLAHEREVEVYLQEQDRLWQGGRARSERDNAPFLARLRRLKAAGARRTPGRPAGRPGPSVLHGGIDGGRHPAGVGRSQPSVIR